MEYFNEMEVVFDSRSENEGFARVAVAAFMTQMDPVLEEVADVSHSEGSGHRYRKRGAGDGATLYDQAGYGSVRDGICIYGSIYG